MILTSIVPGARLQQQNFKIKHATPIFVSFLNQLYGGKLPRNVPHTHRLSVMHVDACATSTITERMSVGLPSPFLMKFCASPPPVLSAFLPPLSVFISLWAALSLTVLCADWSFISWNLHRRPCPHAFTLHQYLRFTHVFAQVSTSHFL